MKILIGSLTYPLPNGVTSSINVTTDGLLRQGHQVLITAPEYKLGKIRPEHRPIKSSRLGKALGALLGKEERLFSAEAPKLIDEIVHGFQPDLFWLHTLTWAPNAFERVMMWSNRPRVLTYHTLVEEYGRLYAGLLGSEVMRTRSEAVANSMDLVIAPSRMIRSKLIEYGVETPIVVIPTGVAVPKQLFTKAELAQKYHFSASDSLLLTIGRVSKEKNIGFLLKAFQQVLRQSPNVTFLIIGPGDLEETKAEAERLGVGRKVICTGPVPKEDAQRSYGAADLFIFASQTETQGLVISEAQLAGVPVVALDSPVREEVYPDASARVVYNQSKFAASIEDLLASPADRTKLGQKGKEFAEKNFTLELMTKKQVAVFQELTEKVGATPGAD